jgi:DNA-binding NtrC family response regulator
VPPITLTDDALEMLINYKWPGNVRQLKNVAEQMTIIEKNRKINAETLKKYLPEEKLNLPILLSELSDKDSISERELIYKYLIDMRRDLNEIKKIVFKYLLSNQPIDADTAQKINDMSVSSLPIKIIEQDSYQSINDFRIDEHSINKFKDKTEDAVAYVVEDSVEDSNDDSNENLSLQDNEKELIVRAIKKHNGRRKLAAEELGISERTLYRKIKEYNLEV